MHTSVRVFSAISAPRSFVSIVRSKPKILLKFDNFSWKQSNFHIMDMSSEDREPQEEYRIGGYHLVNIGETLLQRYFIVRKLGWGYFSTVWLCLDTQEKRSVAIKIMKSNFTGYDEVDILEFMRDTLPLNRHAQRTVKIVESFEVTGKNGTHTCLVMEPLGENLFHMLMRARPHAIPIENVKSIIRQVLEGLEYLHTWCKIIHTDIKPENILLCADEQYTRELTREATELYELKSTTMLSFKSSANKAKRVKCSFDEINPTLSNKVNDSSKDFKVGSLLSSWLSEVDKRMGDMNLKDVKHDGTEIQKDMSNDRTCTSDIDAAEKRNESFLQNLHPQESQVPSILDPNRPLSLLLNNIADNINASMTSNCIKSKNNNDETSATPNGAECLPSTDASEVGKENPRKDPAFEQCKINIKIADFGSACFENHHVTNNIQTPLYRSLEVLLRVGYDTSADIWSTACMAFELATGDPLFNPQDCKQWTSYEDHMGQIMELMGPIPRHMIARSKFGSTLFTQAGTLINRPNLMPMRLDKVLVQKYAWKHEDAKLFANFLEKMLQLDPAKRSTAAGGLKHPWLN